MAAFRDCVKNEFPEIRQKNSISTKSIENLLKRPLNVRWVSAFTPNA